MKPREDNLEMQLEWKHKFNGKAFHSFGSVNILLHKEIDVALYSISCLTVKN